MCPVPSKPSTVARAQTDLPLAEAVAELLAGEERSLRWLAGETGISVSHLSRILRGAEGKRATIDQIEQIATALAVAPGYFVEVREALVIERVRVDAALRERLYKRLFRSSG